LISLYSPFTDTIRFWTLYEADKTLKSADHNILLACSKLTGQTNFSRKLESSSSQLAVLDSLLDLDYHPLRAATLGLSEKMVAGNMRTVFSVPQSRAYMYSGYPSEPILAEAALKVINALDQSRSYPTKDSMASMLSQLRTTVSGGAINMGQRGETVGKMILLRSYMMAVEEEAETGTPLYSTGCSLLTFLKCLFDAEHHEEVETCRPDNIYDGKQLKEEFKVAWVRFTHFARSWDYVGVTTSMAQWAAFVIGMAIIGWPHSNEGVDIHVPVKLHKEGGIGEGSTQIKSNTFLLLEVPAMKLVPSMKDSPTLPWSLRKTHIGLVHTSRL